MKAHPIALPVGRLAVLMPGLGAVATTFIAGVELARRHGLLPVGSNTELGLTSMNGARDVPVRDVVPLATLDELVFGAWDIHSEDGASVAERSGVLSHEHQALTRSFLGRIRPRPGIHDPAAVRRLEASQAITSSHHRDRIDAVRQDILDFMTELGATRAVMMFTASTETYRPVAEVARDLRTLEAAIDRDDPAVTPTVLYAYAAIMEGVPFCNATPNFAGDLPALQQLARERQVPLAGKDLKSGQTLMKTVIAPALRARMLGLRGWFSTNILGNRDGEVLDDPAAFRSKEVTKTGVLDSILRPDVHPALYGKFANKVTIHYYPPRGDEKEGWDNIDIFGWLGYPMQVKINFLCRDSILAAPLVLDLALFMDLASRAGMAGVQDWLSFYFKSPLVPPGVQVEHDLFVQHGRLHQTLHTLAKEPQLEPLGFDGAVAAPR